MSLASDLITLRTKIETLTGENSVSTFAYTETAYNNDDANGHADFIEARENNIPLANNSVIKLSTLVTNKGFREQASSFPRMFINHFCGRVSYNLNKTVDVLYALLVALTSNTLASANGLATLDSNGRVPENQITEDLIAYRGAWNASTNTPNLNTVSKIKGDMYLVSVAGTQTLVDGEGTVVYNVGDQVIFNGVRWQKIPTGNVDSVNNLLPDSRENVTLNGTDIAYSNSRAPDVANVAEAITYIKTRLGYTAI